VSHMKSTQMCRWLPDYLRWSLASAADKPSRETKHLMFIFVDHFELAGKEPRLSEWMIKYPQLARKHSDADGVSPKHSWFYALDLMREGELEQLGRLVDDGLGEVEFHWHHSHDTPESFQEKLYHGLKTFQKHGFMLPIGDGKAGCFGFIHGNWSLNNSRGCEFCGVDNEIELLKKAGCYGDFTFPALHSVTQPGTVNSIYYANFTGGVAGYSTGRKASLGKLEQDEEFLIFEGPLTINWKDWRFKWHPTIENGEIGRSRTHGDPKRIDAWVNAGIHVQGRPEWIFVKIFCHGGQDYQSVLGEETDQMFSYLESRYNDGFDYKLHYVTAREAYNIVKAAEDGKSGDPNHFRNYRIPNPGGKSRSYPNKSRII